MYGRDQLAALITQAPACHIVNMDPISELGKHWVGIYIMKTGNGVYFDSFFRAPKHPDITRLLEKQIKCWIRETK